MSRYIELLLEPLMVKNKKVTGLRFGGNGTMGSTHVLGILEYKAYHMKSALEMGPPHINVSKDRVRAGYHGEGRIYGNEGCDRWFADYDALLDVTSFFVPELVAAYPDSRSFPIRYLSVLNEFTGARVEFRRLAPRHIWKDKPPGDDVEATKTYNNQYNNSYIWPTKLNLLRPVRENGKARI
ncbi:hypothetical protein DL766_008569 [Monosporascus sp. MC13-8B]|uniref:Berberine/berberine-like domain-containing protein n=1 Tax=Monosporascus cannonballus TaxID=155416 RepID=A0ABY0GWS1_9PEZI|nr:hypothetical protein DL762_008237 [Monosporascus cannonballus]RYO83863.1 hypothetical protein DL763_007676 [Monosporascus cannonballus]RYP18994.1 hypothetical protein DL766_008569 [Monosporascus sp. MC13-8B]